MHYFQFHLGDWAKAAATLSAQEEGFYLRLLRRYYNDETPIPQDQVYRSTGARTPEEREAVDFVLSEFFQLDGEVYRNKRADEEIAAYRERSDKAAKSAAKRWENANAMRTHSERNANASKNDANALPTQCERNAIQYPITNIQEEAKEHTARATRLPKDWSPSVDALSWAKRERPDVDANLEADKFRDYWIAQGGQRGAKKDWDATWRNWIRNARGSPKQQQGQPSRQMQAIMSVMGYTDEQAADASRVVLDVNPRRSEPDLLALIAGDSGG